MTVRIMGPLVSALLCAFGSVAIGQPDGAAGVDQRDSLSAAIRAAWPGSGGVHAAFVDPNGFWTRVGYEFSTGNWYYARSDPSQNHLRGRDDRGYYSSDPIGRDPVERGHWDTTFSRILDDYFPQVGLVLLLDAHEIDAQLSERTDLFGGTVTFDLPRGLRFPAADQLPGAEIERWAVDGSALRPSTYEVGEDLSVLAFTFPVTPNRSEPKLRSVQYDRSPRSPEGFQVVSGFGGFALVECSEHANQARPFDRAVVSAEAIEWRLGGRERERTPVYSAAYADEHPELRPEPIEGAPYSGWMTGGAFVGAGAIAILLGTGAWHRARRT